MADVEIAVLNAKINGEDTGADFPAAVVLGSEPFGFSLGRGNRRPADLRTPAAAALGYDRDNHRPAHAKRRRARKAVRLALGPRAATNRRKRVSRRAAPQK
jgi:hypothetical protein